MIANIIFWLSLIPFFTMVLLGMAYGFQLNSFYEQLLPRVPGFAGKQWSDFYPIKAKVARQFETVSTYAPPSKTMVRGVIPNAPQPRRNGVMGKPRENLLNRTCRPISRVTHRAFFPKALTISWPFKGGSLDIER